ncbi:hypothetical protein [Thermofilum sp.]
MKFMRYTALKLLKEVEKKGAEEKTSIARAVTIPLNTSLLLKLSPQ